MAGGAGMNTYVGFGTDVGEKSTTDAKIDVPDLMLQDFRAYDKWWDQMRIASEFFTANAVPFQDMTNRSELVSTGWALEGKGMLVAYFPNGPVGGNRGSADRGRVRAALSRRSSRAWGGDRPVRGAQRKAASGREGRSRSGGTQRGRRSSRAGARRRTRLAVGVADDRSGRLQGHLRDTLVRSEEGRRAPSRFGRHADGRGQGLARSGSAADRSQPRLGSAGAARRGKRAHGLSLTTITGAREPSRNWRRLHPHKFHMVCKARRQ